MVTNWKHIATIADGQKYEIDGLNIWDCKWKFTGEKISVKDSLYGQVHTMNVWEIEDGRKKVKFSAGEFSNCVWGIYREITS